MIFSIKNIGIIKNAEVKVDGLTVISGANNSGKTTVGKTLYSVLSATEDLSKKQNMDRAEAIYNRIRVILAPYNMLMGLYSDSRFIGNGENRQEVALVEQIYMIMTYRYHGEEDWTYYVDLLYKFYQSVDNDAFYNTVLRETKRVMMISDKNLVAVKDEWEQNKQYTLEQCKKAMTFVNSVSSKEEFALKMIDGTLKVEFSGQIQSMSVSNEVKETSYLKLYDDGEQYFNICLKNHNVDMKASQFKSSFFEQGYFVDDPYVIEDNSQGANIRFGRLRRGNYVETLIMPHREKMNFWIKKSIQAERGISESLYQEKQIAEVMEKVNRIVPGDIIQDTYINDGRKLKVGNLAKGSKVFSIIKNILEKGNIGEQALLVLDEPESHLHPRWINALAEIIVLLVKECNITVLLTTHSPNFLLAIDALMRKYNIRKKCHFYQTKAIENDFRIEYIEKTDELDEVYAEYARAFSEMSALRKKYMNLDED